MALVTVRRSPSVTGSPQCSNSDGESDDDDGGKYEKSERFFAGKGTALILALEDVPQNTERRLSTDSTKSSNSTQSNNSDIQQHLQSMFNLLRREETLKMAVKLESQRPNRTRYLVITSRYCFRSSSADRKQKTSRNKSKGISKQLSNNKEHHNHHQQQHPTQQPQETRNNQQHICVESPISDGGDTHKKRQKSAMSNQLLTTTSQTTMLPMTTKRLSAKCDSDKYEKCSDGIEESCLLGIDCNERTTIGLVVPILADTTIHLDGDGGFSVTVFGKTHIFKPVSVQAMWSALQTLHKVSQKARENNFYPGGPSHDWLSYYESRIESEQSCLNEWNAMDAIESRRPPSPDAIRNKPTEKEETESVIKVKLKEIMMSVDLDEVTSKYIRGRLEEHLDMDLGEYKSFIDEEMLTILGQMDAPTEIFEHVYLGSEWNASNLEELQKNGVRHILNVTREIDNFFPGMFDYFNVRVYDDEKTNLLKHWDNTFKYITRAKADGSKVLVHCKMGVSRSASVVIAYAMKAYNWEFDLALQHVKERRNCIKPNKNFLTQLETYRGMLDAMKNKEKLQRSKSETNLKSTKDARLLPGSEPTPLIQALNQSKSKPITDEKQRKILRRSSSTSPKSIQSAIVIKQQSQSLENLTPERSIADEPKNVRFPGSNGENYSVTQNQVLHIQKNTPLTSVKTIVSGLESNDRKTADDKKFLNLQIGRSISVEGKGSSNTALRATDAFGEDCSAALVCTKNIGSPVWTSSAKLIIQTSNIQQLTDEPTSAGPASHRSSFRNDGKNRRDQPGSADLFSSHVDNVFEKEESEPNRKTQSWAPSTFTDATFVPSRQSSNSSVDSAVVLAYPGERRELPSRHSSWGSGDNRVLPSRNSSWGSYDTSKNTFCSSAIFEGQIQDLSKKTANKKDNVTQCNIGTVKRTKQKLEECTVLKKLCQDIGKQMITSSTSFTINVAQQTVAAGSTRSSISSSCSSGNTLCCNNRTSNLCRSNSEASTRQRYSNRCSSEEVILSNTSPDDESQCRPELSVSAPESYRIADEVNQKPEDDLVASTPAPTAASDGSYDEKLSGNVQILKKSFEAKASPSCASKKGQSLPSSPVAQHVNPNAVAPITSTNSLEVDSNINEKSTNVSAISSCVAPISELPAASAAISTFSVATHTRCVSTPSNVQTSREPKDRNVKGLVNKYQSTGSRSNYSASSGGFLGKTRPRSYYETRNICTQKETNHANISNAANNSEELTPNNTLLGKGHDYSDSRPPPVPPLLRNHSTSSTHSNTMTENILTQNIGCNYHRRVQQHGKTHPLARLSLPKQRFNAAAYNTM